MPSFTPNIALQVPLISWHPGKYLWVEQWLLPQEKLTALKQIVDEQLQVGHIALSTSPWNTSVFIIKKGDQVNGEYYRISGKLMKG